MKKSIYGSDARKPRGEHSKKIICLVAGYYLQVCMRTGLQSRGTSSYRNSLTLNLKVYALDLNANTQFWLNLKLQHTHFFGWIKINVDIFERNMGVSIIPFVLAKKIVDMFVPSPPSLGLSRRELVWRIVVREARDDERWQQARRHLVIEIQSQDNEEGRASIMKISFSKLMVTSKSWLLPSLLLFGGRLS